MAKLKESSNRRPVILIILATVSVILLKHSLMKKPAAFSSQTSSRLRVARQFVPSRLGSLAGRNDTGQLDMVQINGYWKEVRESLGFPPLLDAIPFPCEPVSSFGDTLEETDPTFARDGPHLRRLGRLNPALHREYSTSRSRSKDDIQRASFICSDQSAMTRDYDFPQPTSEDSSRDPNDYPYLFIARDSYRAPRTPVGALAASFRAIAARELKAHRGKTHRRLSNAIL